MTEPLTKIVDGDVVELSPEEEAAVLAERAARAARPGPVPRSISRRQFFHRLAIVGIISQAEALAAVKTGDIPAVLQAFVDALPNADDRFNATMLLSGATDFERNHPLTNAVAAAQGMSSVDVDDFFRAASLL